jgi:MFS family permease
VSEVQELSRDRLTAVCYGMVGVWAFYLYFVGPATPVVSEELGVDLQLAGVTSLMLGVGLVASGVVGPPLVRQLGRGRAAVTCAAVLAVAAVALAAAPAFWAVLAAIAVCTLAGALLLNLGNAALTDRHGVAASAAITESQAIAGWLGVIAPLLIGAMVAIGLGWRAAALTVALVALALTLVLLPARSLLGGRKPARPGGDASAAARQEQREEPAGQPRRSSSGFAWSLTGVVAAAGAEISLNFWGGVLIASNSGVELATATASLSALIAGIAVGRTVGSVLTRRFDVRPLVLVSLGMATAGFVTVWQSAWLWSSVLGLFLTGLGLALLFPLMVAMAMFHAGDRTDRAAALVSIVLGVSVGTAPFVLAAVAGWTSVSRAFLIVPVMLAVALIATDRAAPAGMSAARR